ncbi:MAG: HNH endonuclease signature motif containing protein [Candidatus Nitrosocosmicus sp.]|nr:HNH endonuclease [Candidatus Nitrosocosmicus sp.]
MDLITCKCGCGEFIERIKWYRRNYYVKGHAHKPGIINEGKNNHNWKGGIRQHNGYIMILDKERPNSRKRNYTLEHRLVYEQYLYIMTDEKVYIPKDMEIHHINGIKNDNRICNLELITKQEHRAIHHRIDHSNTVCKICGSNYTSNNWYKCENGEICNKCYMKQYHKSKKKELVK